LAFCEGIVEVEMRVIFIAKKRLPGEMSQSGRSLFYQVACRPLSLDH
jgi:hypothetical protein